MDAYNGTQTVTAYGPSCPQQSITLPIVSGLVQEAIDVILNGIYQVILPSSEDCEFYLVQRTRFPDTDEIGLQGLSINVIVPAGTQPGAKLTVAVVSTVDYHMCRHCIKPKLHPCSGFSEVRRGYSKRNNRRLTLWELEGGFELGGTAM